MKLVIVVLALLLAFAVSAQAGFAGMWNMDGGIFNETAVMALDTRYGVTDLGNNMFSVVPVLGADFLPALSAKYDPTTKVYTLSAGETTCTGTVNGTSAGFVCNKGNGRATLSLTQVSADAPLPNLVGGYSMSMCECDESKQSNEIALCDFLYQYNFRISPIANSPGVFGARVDISQFDQDVLRVSVNSAYDITLVDEYSLYCSGNLIPGTKTLSFACDLFGQIAQEIGQSLQCAMQYTCFSGDCNGLANYSPVGSSSSNNGAVAALAVLFTLSAIGCIVLGFLWWRSRRLSGGFASV